MKKIAYFSYKGGAGRSSLAYNTIPLLAEKLNATPENPIILLDLDVDSAGLTFLLKCAGREEGYFVQDVVNGTIPGLTRSPEDTPLSSHPFFSQLVPVGRKFGLRGDKNEAILFLPVKTGMNISFDGTYDRPENYLMLVSKLCNKYKCKALILDTPTGDQLTAKWSLEIAKDILTTMKITYQFRHGTMDFLQRKDREYCEKNFILVPNCVPTEEIKIDGIVYNYEAVKEEIIATAKASMKQNNIDISMLQDGDFGVPEVKRFKLQEGILYTLDYLTEDEEKAYKMYAKVVNTLTKED